MVTISPSEVHLETTGNYSTFKTLHLGFFFQWHLLIFFKVNVTQMLAVPCFSLQVPSKNPQGESIREQGRVE